MSTPPPQPFIIPRPHEAAQLDAWYQAILVASRDQAPRLVVISGEDGIGKHDLLSHWRSLLANDPSRPVVATTVYQPAYLTEDQQRTYYDSHPDWQEPWRLYAGLVESRWPHAVTLGGFGLLALATTILDQSGQARSYLASSEPQPADPVHLDEAALRHALSDLLRHAVTDGPLVLLIEGIQHAPTTFLSLLHLWRQELAGEPWLVVLAVDTPYHLHNAHGAPQVQDPWLDWLRDQTAPFAPRAEYLHLGPLRVDDVRALLADDSQAFARDLCFFTAGKPLVLKELLRHWSNGKDKLAQRLPDGRWRIVDSSLDSLPGSLETRYLNEPLAVCAARAQDIGYDLQTDDLLGWLQLAAWEGDTFTDEALARAVGWHGDALQDLQEVLDEAMVHSSDNPQGILREIDDTVAIPTAELERPWRYMARYQFRPPILALVLRQRGNQMDRWQGGQHYLHALLAAYSPRHELIALRLVEIAFQLGLMDWKARHLDLSPLLVGRPASEPDVAGNGTPRGERPCAVESASLDELLLARVEPALRLERPVQVVFPVRNIHRAVGARISGEITRRFGAPGLPEDAITLRLEGLAGQSFGAFAARGLTLHLEGEANDYLGKGLSGGRLVVAPPRGSTFVPRENIIVGNVALYGATSGEAFIRGVAGERFAVRNSGARAVVEGVGDHGCEYMTGGVVVVLGRVGRNFAAGMSGGLAYVLDDEGSFVERCNMAMVVVEPLASAEPEEIDALIALLVRHRDLAGSEQAAEILEHWKLMRTRILRVVPVELARRARREARSRREASSSGGL